MASRPHSDSHHILLVDDDNRIRRLLQQFLARSGYWCTVARNAAHAERLLEFFRFDLIILDIMMPGENGVNFAGRMRCTLDTPIIFLSARVEVEDRLDGFRAGADDYVPKPFNPDELLLRLQAILRRTQDSETEAPIEVGLGQYRFNSDRGELWQGERQIRLSPSEVFMMRRLARTPNQPVARTDLVDGTFEESDLHSLDRAIHLKVARLRKKFEKDPRNPLYLKTARGIGYILVPD